ncbi:hypothetical protein [Arthrobacter cavernae]|uniref:hypothetical protein n=1 Tax=Arthrobacter cavernae TaxID=2817681 RepID=UPI001F618354|nr:hypothetical protein [Arthrobacter cavernae]
MIGKTRLGNSVNERSGAIPDRPAVPWLTVVSLAVLMAYADGFWMISLRGAVGAIERTQGPFVSWLIESTAALPVFVLAVLAALTLALRWFGPVFSKPRTVMATGLLVAVAGTLAGTAEIAASSAWDYHLQLQLMDASHHSATGTTPSSLEQATLGLQLRAIGYGSGILFITNLVLLGWAVAIQGGRLTVSRAQRRTPRRDPVDPRRLFLAAVLFGSAAIHAAVVPEHLGHWAAAGAFFLILAAAQLAAGVLVLLRRQRTVLLAAAAVSIVPLVLWLHSRTVGLPFGPEAGVPEAVGLADCAASLLELGTLLLAVILLRDGGRLHGRPPASAHLRALPVVAAIAVSVMGLAGTGWFGNPGHSGHESVAISQH